MRKLTDRELLLIKNGMGITIDGVSLGFTWENNVLRVEGMSQWTNPDFITKSIALKELEQIKEIALELIKHNKELQEKKYDKIEFYLLMEDGRNAVVICKEIDGKIEWI